MDKGAVISRIDADLVECERKDEIEHTARFFLLKPDGRNFDIFVSDEGTARVVKVGNVSREVGPILNLSTKQQLTDALKATQLGPREVCRRTLSERDAILGEDSWFSRQSVRMILDYDQQERFGVPAIWEVTYYDASKVDTRVDDRNLKFIVSPVDGSILERFLNFESVTPIPSVPVSAP